MASNQKVQNLRLMDVNQMLHGFIWREKLEKLFEMTRISDRDETVMRFARQLRGV